MDSTSPQSGAARGLLRTLTSAVRDGVDRYRALGDAPEARRLLAAAAGSYIGDRFNTIALIALSFEFGNSALGVGGMLALLALPRLVIQAAAGSLVDRYPGKRLLMLTQLLMALIAGSFALLAVVPSLWLLYGLTLAMGIVRTADIPAFEVRLMALTPPPLRGTVNALHMMAWTAGEIIGPLLGALVLALAGATPLFLLNGASFLVVVWMIRSLPEWLAAAEAATERDEEAATPKLGYRFLLRRSDVMLYTATVATSCVLILGAIPLFIARSFDLGLGESGVGLFYATMGVGTLIGGILAGAGTYTTVRALGIAAVAGIVGSICLILFGFATTVLLALPALVFYGMIGDLQEITGLTFFQHTLPEGIYGRFISLFMMATGAGGLIGALGGPLLAEVLGIGQALFVLALPTLILSVVFGIREGGLRVGLPVFVPVPEPEVVGHGMFGVPSHSDLIPDGRAGGSVLKPRLHRLI